MSTVTHNEPNRSDVPREETLALIASDKVEGTAVYGADSKKIGSIENLMMNKRNGQVAYAVLGFGGWLGMDKDHYPLPWNMLKYDPTLGGYIIGLTKEVLEGAPKYADDESWNWDAEGDREIDTYYGDSFVSI